LYHPFHLVLRLTLSTNLPETHFSLIYQIQFAFLNLHNRLKIHAMMKHTLQFKLMVLISLSTLCQLVQFSEQLPQSSDEVGHYSTTQPNQNDDRPVVPREDITDPEDEDSSDDSDKITEQNEPSHVKGFHLKKRNAIFGNAEFSGDKIPFLTHDFLDRKRRSYNPNEDAQENRGIRMSDSKKDFPRSFNKRSADIYRYESELISGDERLPYDIFRNRRSADDENSPDKAVDASDASPPALSTQHLDKSTDINTSITNPDRGTVHLPIEDVLSLLKKRSAHENEGLGDSVANSESGKEILSVVNKEETADLDVAESSLIFKPLFRYRSQVGLRRTVFNNYE